MGLFEKIRNTALKIFGDIKIFRYPFFILYNPQSYLVKGDDIRTVINNIQPGDILVRGYRDYVDGYFIPGFFSHVGLYLGKTDTVPDYVVNKGKSEEFVAGEQTVIHAMAEGVFMEDVINFCRCDYLVILRRSEKVETKNDIFEDFQNIYKNAMENLGKPYDFKFDFTDVNALSCTEFVYECCKGFLEKYGVTLKRRSVLFYSKEVLIPDDFVTDNFTLAFKSNSVPMKKLNKVLMKNRG